MVLERLTAEEITEFITQVLLAYYMREAERLQAIIEVTGTKNRSHELWPQFKEVSEDDDMALCQFTQFIMAQLDGGDCKLPETT